jgi:hypothetical protein
LTCTALQTVPENNSSLKDTYVTAKVEKGTEQLKDWRLKCKQKLPQPTTQTDSKNSDHMLTIKTVAFIASLLHSI